MQYKLVVTKFEKNPKWAPQRDMYSREKEELEYLTNQEVLIVCLNDQEFQAVKKAVVEVIQ